jgi:phosphoribosylaminoimidazole carboxylase
MNKKIGILGGGQLAMMLIEAARRLGITNITILDPNPNCPASTIGVKQIVGSFRDKLKILELAEQVDILTIDIENVDEVALGSMINLCDIYPDPLCIGIIKDKWVQNSHFSQTGIEIPKFYSVSDKPKSWTKYIVKSKIGGYDGKGVWLIDETGINSSVSTFNSIDSLIKKYGMNKEDIFVEEHIVIKKELAVMGFGYYDDDCKLKPMMYPIVETIQKNGICSKVICPINLHSSVREKVKEIVNKVLCDFNTLGMFGFEFFLDVNNNVLLNEVSPRVHNTGHYTIEACNCSQFEQHIRSITGLPVIEPKLIVPHVVMQNILANGEINEFNNLTKTNNKSVGLHWYNKETNNGQYKINRKIGHITKKLELTSVPYPLVYVVMGSSSDLPILRPAIELLKSYKIPHKVDIVSAHRSPEWMVEFGKNVESLCVKVVIAAAGGAAHLPGMLASLTPLPVIGVPVPSKYLSGQDSLLSIVEMPDGVPVATVGIGKAKNAAILALKILGATKEVKDIMEKNKEKVNNQRRNLMY